MLRILIVFLAALNAFPDAIIRDVSVVDVVTGQIEPHRDIVIRGMRIAAIHPAASRLKGTRYAIPGLWDMRVHLSRPQLTLYVKNGVTGVRDVGTDLKQVRAWQAEIANGAVVGPRIYACGAPLSGEPSTDPNRPVTLVRTPAEARAAFLRYYDQKVDFIQVLALSEKSFEALAEMSRHDGVPFAGQMPLGVSDRIAAEDRIVSMDRLSVTPEAIDSFDPHAMVPLWDLFRRYDVRQTPSLAFWARTQGGDSRNYEFACRMTREMAKAGVPLLAGSDSGEPGTQPGIELHKELELMVQAGLTPAQALRTATTEPARLMHRGHDVGEVKAGYEADLVILTADPLANIANTRHIESVVVRGRIR